MKLTVLQENLNDALHIASRFTSPKAQLPVLANLLLSAEKNRLIISSTNLEISSSVSIGAKVENVGQITVPSRTLTDIVANLKPGSVNLNSDKEHLEIRLDGFTSSVSGMNASDFPSVPKELGKSSVTLKAKKFSEVLSYVLFAVSTDETRPVLTGVLMIIDPDKLELVATDGFRLSRSQLRLGKSGKIDSDRLIIPKTALSELSRLGAGENEIGFSFNKEESRVVFSVGNTILSSRIIEGDFPDFEKIIPKNNQVKLDLNKEDFLRSVKLASVFARDSANVVKIEIGKKNINITSESSQSGSQKNSVDAKVQGLTEDISIAFNYRFLEEFLGSVTGENVLVEINDASSPGVFLDPKDKNYLHLIMPVKLQE